MVAHEYECNMINEFGTDYKTNLENAAPDLLKALERLYNHTKNNQQIFGLNAEAREAIDKAKGVK